jgi:hypothetical protein
MKACKGMLLVANADGDWFKKGDEFQVSQLIRADDKSYIGVYVHRYDAHNDFPRWADCKHFAIYGELLKVFGVEI